MRVNVKSISVPAMSTIGYGKGVDEHGYVIEFAGDHRMMQTIGEALLEADDEVWAEVPEYAVFGPRGRKA